MHIHKTLLVTLTCAAYAIAFTDWGYGPDDGPEEWCNLDPEFELCCEGMNQSPVDIITPAAEHVDLDDLVFLYTECDYDVEHNGHSIEAIPEVVQHLQVGSDLYELVQFHFHTGSEHAFNGRYGIMELHMVHVDVNTGTVLVVGFLIHRGAQHQELELIFSALPQSEGEHVDVHDFDLNQLLPANRNSYRYRGSFTTPPCTEGVRWVVMAETLQMSSAQILNFIALFSGTDYPDGNRRPVQPMNNRKIHTDV